jgi:alkylation response protein AidB-like acyl-CoA dehydrogenase
MAATSWSVGACSGRDDAMLIDELEVASRVMPGLAQALSARGLMDLEASGGEVLAGILREHGEPAYLVSRDLGGSGGSLLEISQILRVVGARCPSLSIMMTMHHHTVATFARGCVPLRGSDAVLRRVVGERALVASAFAEGRPVKDVLESNVQCTRLDAGAGFRIAGTKKPCSMTHHADFVVVGVSVDLEQGDKHRGMALVDTTLDGIRTEEFWPAEILASADCNCLIFDGVIVPDEYVLAPRDSGRSASRTRLLLAHAEIAMSCLFQLMISARYLGMATRLGEDVLKRRRGTPAERVEILSGLETTAMSICRLAQLLEHAEISGYRLAQSMLVAHNAAAQIERAVSACARAMGGSGYLASREAQYLVLASRCLVFHPPFGQVREQIVDGCYTDVM